MKAHIQYLWYVICHKWFVLQAGVKVKAPIWRLLIHDLSKFSITEWNPYVKKFYTDRTDPNAFKRAWLHHQNVNPHHWQYWILISAAGKHSTLEMPKSFAREMVADWMGAGKAITGRWDIHEWYAANKTKIKLHSDTRAYVENILDNLEI